MIKQKTILEVKIGDRLYEFCVAPDSPLGEIHDAIMQIKGAIVDRMVKSFNDEKEAVEVQKKVDEQTE